VVDDAYTPDVATRRDPVNLGVDHDRGDRLDLDRADAAGSGRGDERQAPLTGGDARGTVALARPGVMASVSAPRSGSSQTRGRFATIKSAMIA